MQRSRIMKFFHTFYLVIIAILVTLLVVERQNQHDNNASIHHALNEQLETMQLALAESFSDLQDTLQAEFNDIRGALDGIAQDEDDYPRTRPASAEQPPLNRVTPAAATDNNLNAQNDASQAETRQATEQPALTSRDYARLGAAITDNFNTRHELFELQSVDPDWAYPTRESIENLFYQHDYLRELQLIDVECRSSICRVDLSESDPDTVNPARLLQALNALNDDLVNEHYQFNSQPQDFGYRVYIQRLDSAAIQRIDE